MPDPISSTAASHHRRPVVQPEPRRSRLLLTGVPVLAVFAVFGAVVWLAYQDGVQGGPVGEPPLIRADATPIKLPASEANTSELTAADEGSVGRLWSDDAPDESTERLLPLPEEPQSPELGGEVVAELPRGDQASDAEPSLEVEGDAALERSDDAAPALAEVSPPEDATPSPGVAEPGDAQTVAGAAQEEVTSSSRETAEAALDRLLAEVADAADLPEDGNASEPEEITAALESRAASEPERAAQTSAAAAAAPVTPPEPATTSGTSPQATDTAAPTTPAARSAVAAAPSEPRPEPVDEQPAAATERPAPTAALTPRVTAVPDGDYRIQLAAVRAEADAQRAWDLFQVDLGPVLSELQPFFERAETANGVFYRVQVGPLGSQDDAETLCEQLKQLNASCFVVRR